MDKKANLKDYDGCNHISKYKPYYRIKCGMPVIDGTTLCKHHLEQSTGIKHHKL